METNGIFIYLLSAGIGLGIYLLNRLRQNTPTSDSEHLDFAPMPSTSPVSAELDPRSIEETSVDNNLSA